MWRSSGLSSASRQSCKKTSEVRKTKKYSVNRTAVHREEMWGRGIVLMAPGPCRWTVTGRTWHMVPSVLLLCLPGNIRRWRRAMPRFRSAASRRHPCGRPPVESMYGTYGGGRSSVCPAARSPYENFLLQCHLKQGACFQQAACLGGAHRSAKAGCMMGRPGGKGPQSRQGATSPSRAASPG